MIRLLRPQISWSVLRYLSTTAPSVPEVLTPPLPDKSCLYGVPTWRDASSLTKLLTDSVVMETRDFVVLDKPAGLSAWGHGARKKHSKQYQDHDGLNRLSIKDCLPQLAEHFSAPRLTLSCAIEAEYSGLIMFSKNEEHAKLAEDFYTKAYRNHKMKGAMFQSILAICRHGPSSNENEPSMVHIESMPITDHSPLRISFLSLEPSGQKARSGLLLRKWVGHRVLSRASFGSSSGQESPESQVTLVEIVSNSTYRGVVELYLLHKGAAILGEHLQASRLSWLLGVPVVQLPEKAVLQAPLPTGLLKRLQITSAKAQNLPMMAHRARLTVPTAKGLKVITSSVSNLPNHFQYTLRRLTLDTPSE